MKDFPAPLDLRKIKVFPLAQRRSLSAIEKVLVAPDSVAPPSHPEMAAQIQDCVNRIKLAREHNASVMLIYGAHLVKNGLLPVVNQLVAGGWITHLATNGAGTIHDWELSFFGRTEESVRENVATGTFGTWDETGRNIHLALLAGALRGEGYGRSLGRFMVEDGVTLPTAAELENALRNEPAHPLAPARAELLQAAFDRYQHELIRQTGFGCMAELLLKLKNLTPIIHEVPLILRYDMKQSDSKMKILRTIKETLLMLGRDKLRGH